ncbi:MAG TPA: hypothetical protein VEL47_05670 [Myxococcota bacterium]|nr:hypothetical protein [Myxococcota bacterium]
MKLLRKNIVSVLMLALFVRCIYAVDYEAEKEAAKKGAAWYGDNYQKYIPTDEELEHGSYNPIDQIKIRLPIDLKRIIDDHVLRGKPVSLAVACGDRELPFRAQFAARVNDPSRPAVDDFDNLETEKLDSNKTADNYISLDRYLGMPASRDPDLRGAGHIMMDAQDAKNWEQLFDFLDAQQVKLHQIIFTAMINEESVLDPSNPLNVIYQRLTPGGQLVFPYYGSYWEHNRKYFAGSEWLTLENWGMGQPFIKIAGEMSEALEGDNLEQIQLPGSGYAQTKFGAFFTLARKLSQNQDIDADLDQLFAKTLAGKTSNYRNYAKNVISYYLSIYDEKAMAKALESQSVGRMGLEVFKESVFEQNKKVWSYFLDYLKQEGFNAQLISSPKVASILAPSVVTAQNWKAGDYPYGERDHIALVITK